MWHSGDGMGWWMIWGGLMMILFWSAIVGLIVWGVQAATKRDGHEGERGPQRPALDIAKERYARGEIGREEFEQIASDFGKP